jgi:hypothetical protein
MIKIRGNKDNINYFIMVEPDKNAFGKYVTKDHIHTKGGKIPRNHVTSVEKAEEPWNNEEEKRV